MQVKSAGLVSELMVRRAAGSQVEDHGDWLVVRTPSNPGFWWGNCLIASSPVARGQAPLWRRRFTEAFPDAKHFTLGIDDPSGFPGDARELEALGVEIEVSTVLTASPGEVAISRDTSADDSAPHGLERVTPEVRLLDLAPDWEQLLLLRHACDDPAVPAAQTAAHEQYLAGQVEEHRQLVASSAAAWFGAFQDGRLAAALGLVSDRSGQARYQHVQTDPDQRRRGLARALVQFSALHAATSMAATSLVIVADPAYHAIDLYRGSGFRDQGHLVQLQAGSY